MKKLSIAVLLAVLVASVAIYSESNGTNESGNWSNSSFGLPNIEPTELPDVIITPRAILTPEPDIPPTSVEVEEIAALSEEDEYVQVTIWLDESDRALNSPTEIQQATENVLSAMDARALVDLKNAILTENEEGMMLSATSLPDFVVTNSYSHLPAVSGLIRASMLDEIGNLPGVDSVMPSERVYASLVQSNPMINATLANMIEVGTTNITGAQVAVCVLDTGVRSDHAYLGGRVIAEKCYLTSSECPNDLTEDDDATDDHGHGTHVAGIIASESTTYKGVAPAVNIVAVKVLNSAGSGIGSDVISGIDYCIAQKNVYNITAIVMSLGSAHMFATEAECDPNSATARAANDAHVAGIFVVAAAGNYGNASGVSPPACGTNVTAVGAVYDFTATSIITYTLASCTDDAETKGNVTCFSNSAPALDLLAPGANITSSWYTSTSAIGRVAGTSQAAPHVAAAGALLAQYGRLYSGRNLTPSEIKQALIDGGVDYTDPRNSIETPILNVYQAMQMINDGVAVNVTYPITTGNRLVTNHSWTIVNVSTSDRASEVVLQVWSNPNNVRNMTMRKLNDTRFTINISRNATNYSRLGLERLSLNISKGWDTNDYVVDYINATAISTNALGIVNHSSSFRIYLENRNFTNLSYLPAGNTSTDEGLNVTFNVTFYDYHAMNTTLLLIVDGDIVSRFGHDSYQGGVHVQNVTLGNWSEMCSLNFSVPRINRTYDMFNATWNNATVNVAGYGNYTFYRNSEIQFMGCQVRVQNFSNVSGVHKVEFWYREGAFSTEANFSDNSANYHNVSVNYTDGEYSFLINWTVLVNESNDIPDVSNVNITSGTRGNYSNGSIRCNFSFIDNDYDSTTPMNETRWYKNNVSQAWTNVSTILAGNLSKYDVWICSVRVHDDYDWSNFTNGSITIRNAPPTRELIDDYFMPRGTNRTNVINLSEYFTDIDNATLNFSARTNTSINNFTVILRGANVSFNTSHRFAGSVRVTFNASDESSWVTDVIIVKAYYCGDDECDPAESSSNCEEDCGSSDDDSSGGDDDDGGGGLPGGTTTPSLASEVVQIASIAAGATGNFRFVSTSLPITNIQVRVKTAVEEPKITVKQVDPASLGTMMLSTLAGGTYQYLDMSAVKLTSTNIDTVTIDFKIPRSWFQGYIENSLVMKRYVNSQWVDLPTTKVATESTWAHYRATSPGFSIFALYAQKPEIMLTASPSQNLTLNATQNLTNQSTPTPTPTETPPADATQSRGSGIVGKVIALILVLCAVGLGVFIYLHKRKKPIGQKKEETPERSEIMSTVSEFVKERKQKREIVKEEKKHQEIVSSVAEPADTSFENLPEVLRFVAKMRSNGESDTVIRKKLIDAGWPEKLVTRALSKQK